MDVTDDSLEDKNLRRTQPFVPSGKFASTALLPVEEQICSSLSNVV